MAFSTARFMSQGRLAQSSGFRAIRLPSQSFLQTSGFSTLNHSRFAAPSSAGSKFAGKPSSAVLLFPRNLHTSQNRSSAIHNVQVTKNQLNNDEFDVFRGRVNLHTIQKYSAIGLAVLLPTAIFAPSGLWMLPIDTAIVTCLAGHSWVGAASVVEDYFPGKYLSLGKFLLFLLVSTTFLGLLRITWCGRGLTETFMTLWRSGPLDDDCGQPVKHGSMGQHGPRHGWIRGDSHEH